MSIRTALIVLAHPDPLSFNAALARMAADTLAEEGVEVLSSNLYADGFQPVAGRGDMTDAPADGPFNLALEQGRAFEAGTLSADIRREQEKVRAADLLIFQFPLWWYSMPAILKGWIDRVFSYKFAYGVGQWWDRGPFRNKRAMLSITTGTPASAYAPDGRNGDIARILWPLEAGILGICGFQVLPSYVAFGAPWIGEEGRRAQMSALAERVRAAQTTTPCFFHPLSDYGEDHRLKPEIVPRTPGQHRVA